MMRSAVAVLCLGLAAQAQFAFPDQCETQTTINVTTVGPSGLVDYPEGLRAYPANARVCWYLECPAEEGPFLRIKFTRMDTEGGYDTVQLYRVGGAGFSLATELSGGDLTQDIVFEADSALVLFSSDQVVQFSGFAYEWECSNVQPTAAPTPVPTPEPTLAPTPVPTPVPAPTQERVCVEVSVSRYDDDAEQARGRMNYDSKRLDLGRHRRVGQTVGMRFQGLGVPQGAEIVDARVTFVGSRSSRRREAVLDVAFEAANNSVRLGLLDLESRVRTSGMEWRINQRWRKGAQYVTPDLSAQLQEVVNKKGFEAGNAVTVLISKGEGHRANRYARSADKGSPPVLRVCYLGEMGTPAPGPAPGTGNAAHCGPRVRRAYSTLTCAERQFYADAVNTLMTTDSDTYWKLVETHVAQESYAHGTSAFLPWHRQFVLQYENLLRAQPGFECVTVPYWDWERDAQNEFLASPMKGSTFGSFENHAVWTQQCINSGIAAGWRKRNGECITRRRLTDNQFTGEAALTALVANWADWSGFSGRLEGAPHAAPHNYVSGEMSSMESPYDPVFFIHHANVDRLWALWQDYHGYDKVPKENLTSLHYSPRGRGFGIATDEAVALDAQMPYGSNVTGFDFPLPALATPVTPRDMWNIRDMPDGVSYEYGPDNLAEQLGDVLEGEWDWVVPASSDKRTCCGDATTDPNEQCDDGNFVDNDDCSNLCRLARTTTSRAGSVAQDDDADDEDEDEEVKTGSYTKRVPLYANRRVQMKYDQLLQKRSAETKKNMLTELALYECSLLQSRDATLPEWKAMVPLPKAYYDQCKFFSPEVSEIPRL